MFRTSVGVIGVTGILLVSSAGPVSPARTEAVAPSATSTPAAGPRLTHFGPTTNTEVGGPIWFGIEGMPEGWKLVTVTSPALTAPVPLVPVQDGTPGSGRVVGNTSKYRIRSDIAPGTYVATATSEGRTVAAERLTVVAQGAADIGRFVFGPRDAFPGGTASAAVRPGGEALVVLADAQPGEGEESLVVRSPVFARPLTIRKNSPDDPGCKCDDGTTLYAGHATVREDIAAGTYPMTVVSHHGQQTTTRQVTVAGEPVAPVRRWLIGCAAVLLVLAAAGWIVARRRRKAIASA